MHPQITVISFILALCLIGAVLAGSLAARFPDSLASRVLLGASLIPLLYWAWLLVATPHRIERGMSSSMGALIGLMYLGGGVLVGGVLRIMDRALGYPRVLMSLAVIVGGLLAASFYHWRPTGDMMGPGLLFLMSSLIALPVAGYLLLDLVRGTLQRSAP